ncbi:hypothetical protein Clacol_007666 [Clathrus columnatus]|uniref:Inosine/uridine-preferring nucleoside hydrolase domain-containing protein n=1 Tax=Clathrus columnatus TaxID=1419009 RepID=A0AAV5AFJ5_9AGAM|nr:hypothetical protein Clacol_007666 [Clathrus columnatus]
MFRLSAALVLAGLASIAYAVPTAIPTATALTCPGFTPPIQPVPSKPKNIIIDTDLLSFTDDDVTSNYSLPAIDAINTWYCHPDIPFAQTNDLTTATKEPTVTDNDKIYITTLSDSKHFKQDFDRKTVQDPVEFYTNILKDAEDDSVTILAIGFLTHLNNFYNSKEGPGLIKSKVKELVFQGGSCNTTDNPHSAGFNLIYDLQSAQVLTKWPSPVTFLPGYTANNVEVGRSALNTSTDSPIRFVYETVNYPEHYKFGSADPLATYYAAFGISDLFAYGNEDGKGGLRFVKDESSSVASTEYDDSVWDNTVSPPEQQRYLMYVMFFLS